MRKLMIPMILSVFLLAAIFGLVWIARGQSPARPNGLEVVNSEAQGDNVREIYAPAGAAPEQPNIGFIDSPTATCYQPDSTKDVCLLNWYYMSVDANPNYIVSMTVQLNDIGFVARMGGFFQTSMYAPYNLFDRGFQVACGALGAGGSPYWGNLYAWTIRARDSANLGSANYGTTYCPAYIP